MQIDEVSSLWTIARYTIMLYANRHLYSNNTCSYIIVVLLYIEFERTKDGRQGENQNSLPHLLPQCVNECALTVIENIKSYAHARYASGI